KHLADGGLAAGARDEEAESLADLDLHTEVLDRLVVDALQRAVGLSDIVERSQRHARGSLASPPRADNTHGIIARTTREASMRTVTLCALLVCLITSVAVAQPFDIRAAASQDPALEHHMRFYFVYTSRIGLMD